MSFNKIESVLITVIMLFCIFISMDSFALDITLSWNPSPGATGYKIYYSSYSSKAGPPYNGTGADEGPSPIDAGNVTQFTMHNLSEEGNRFAITAYNSYGESGYSSEAVLAPQKYSLFITTSGSGAVSPAGGTYTKGATVQLMATPATGWVFRGWSGDLNSTANPSAIVMDGNKTVTATFTQLPTQYTLSVNTTGQGSVSPAGGTYSKGATVQLKATPASGWVFSGWSGGLNSTANPSAIVMDGNKTVTAAFTQLPAQYALSVNTTGQGSVSPAGGTYNRGATVQLKATPASGWIFSGWSGDVSGTTNPVGIQMNSNKVVTANFRQMPPVINKFAAMPETICEGESALLIWDISGAEKVTIDNGIGMVDRVRGSVQVSPVLKTKYTLTASNAAGSRTGSITVAVGPSIVNVIPHDGAGVQDNYRVPINTSFAVHIFARNGIDLTKSDNIKFIIYSGNHCYIRSLKDTQVVKVTKLTNEPDTCVTKMWTVYHRAADSIFSEYNFDRVIQIVFEVNDKQMDSALQINYEFKTETETEYNNAVATSPVTTMIAPSSIRKKGYDAGLIISSGQLKSAKIIYNSSSAVMPEVGPIEEIPNMNLAKTSAVGKPVNLQPPTVFERPVIIYIPCPGYSNVGGLSVFMYNGKDWVAAFDTAGRVQPGCVGSVVPGSRVNHNSRSLSTIEVRIYRSGGFQAGKVTTY
ncbi:hypothetical protein PITCH_A640019 [uncultured Desulfobacterium sp.]|uniref:Bacterial repeat domain-containing protein n=1 Tax=uncultured Desulfobacterium sp. TaxID=201089 RepID=A0A445N148_9BACT|nr:hypothetical protein PITCH_A640019 [uncultured Desulfobacterium sp.]